MPIPFGDITQESHMPTKTVLSLLLVASLGFPVVAQKQQVDSGINKVATELQQFQKPYVDWEAKQFTIELKQLGDPEINRMLPEIYEAIKSSPTEALGPSKEPSAGGWKNAGPKSSTMWLLKDPSVRREIQMLERQYEAGQSSGMDMKSRMNQQDVARSGKGDGDIRTTRLGTLLKTMDRNGNGMLASGSSSGGASDDKPSSKSTPVDPLVPGFGDPSVPGFGVHQEAASNSDGGSDDRFQRIVQFMMFRYDKNGNGVLDKVEWWSMQGHLKPADTNKDSRLTPEEITRWMAERMGGGGRAARSSSEGNGPSGSESSPGNGSRSYRWLTAHERLKQLEEELPSWFLEKDAREFVSYDRNNDGVITPRECLQYEGRFEKESELVVASSSDSDDVVEKPRTAKTTSGARFQRAKHVENVPDNERATFIPPAIRRAKGYSDEKIKWYFGEMKRKKAGKI